MPCYSYERERDSGRRNDAGGADVDEEELQHPFAQGSTRYVARGKYISGRRKGQPCVVKWNKRGRNAGSYSNSLRIAHRALELVEAFNAASVMDAHIVLNVPEKWEIDPDEYSYLAGRKVLIEPFIYEFEKWNSNSGWTKTRGAWARAMQALSHFSYNRSGGRELLCDLQGGFYDYAAVLTDPAICSVRREFGPTDLGRKGIDTFFANHECNEFCRADWRTPRHPHRYFQAHYGTTMVNALGGRGI